MQCTAVHVVHVGVPSLPQTWTCVATLFPARARSCAPPLDQTHTTALQLNQLNQLVLLLPVRLHPLHYTLLWLWLCTIYIQRIVQFPVMCYLKRLSVQLSKQNTYGYFCIVKVHKHLRHTFPLSLYIRIYLHYSVHCCRVVLH